MKKLFMLMFSILSVSMALPTLAKKPMDAGKTTNIKQVRISERANEHKRFVGTGEQSKTIVLQKRKEARESRIDARAQRFEKKYNKKTALMVKHFDKKLAIFEEHLKDEILLKVYPIFIDKLERFKHIVENQDINEELKKERLDYLFALTNVISEELTNLQESLTSSDENIEDNDENIEDNDENIEDNDENIEDNDNED